MPPGNTCNHGSHISKITPVTLWSGIEASCILAGLKNNEIAVVYIFNALLGLFHIIIIMHSVIFLRNTTQKSPVSCATIVYHIYTTK